MNRVYLIVLAAVLTAASSAQEPVGGPVETLKARSRIVVVDVVVTDSKGSPVRNLNAVDFTLLEDKKPQTIRHFDEHDAPDPKVSLAYPQLKMPPNTFTNVVVTPPGSALNIILLDALNTPTEFQPKLRSDLAMLADSLPGNSRTAIFGLSGDLVMLQSFTSDPAVLKTILTQRRRMPTASTLQPGVAPEAASSQTMKMDTNTGAYNSQGYDPTTAMARFERVGEQFMIDERVRKTLAALENVAQYMAALPGRKNLIWISGSFPLTFIPGVNSGGGPTDNTSNYSEEIERVDADLARSQVAVYPVDARGVQTDIAYSAALPSLSPGKLAADPNYYHRMSTGQADNLVQEHATMNRMAEETGGHAFFGSNDIAGLVSRAMTAGSSYYTLTYIPTNTERKGKRREIKVKVEGQRLQLAYRTSYIAKDQTVTANNQQTTPESERTQSSAVASSMRRGAPTPTEILFKILVTASPVIQPPPHPEVPTDVGPLATVSKKPQRRYRVDYAVAPDDIHWEMHEGKRSANVQLMLVGYDGNGNVINMKNRELALNLTEENYAAAVQGGLQVSQEIAMPAKGEYYLRVGVMDKSTNHIGSVEVSTSALMVPKS